MSTSPETDLASSSFGVPKVVTVPLTVSARTDPWTPVTSPLVRRQAGVDLNLEGVDLQHINFDGQVVYRNSFAGARFSEDDLAVADLLAAMGAWRRGEGPEPYPLAEACQDHLIALAINESAVTRQAVTTTAEGWTNEDSDSLGGV